MSATINPPDYAQITTIIFDLDGTLIEHTWQLSRITETLFARFAADLAPITCDEFYDLFWPKNEDMWYMMVAGVLTGETAAKYSYINTLRALGQDTGLAEPMPEIILANLWNLTHLPFWKPCAQSIPPAS